MNSKRILIVDDEAHVAFFLKEGLTGLGTEYEVSVSRSAELALSQLRRRTFDLLVADFRLPGINGLELIRQMREISPQTKVIMITAYGTPEIESEAYQLDAYRYFNKPFHIEELMGTVRGALT